MIGRLGQSFLAIISWTVFAAYVTTSMGLRPITYKTFWIIFIDSEPSIYALGSLIRDFTSRRGLVSKPAMIFILLVTSFILAFPTMISAMTAYDLNNQAYIMDRSQNMLSPTEFRPIAFIVHDGLRAGFPRNDYPVAMPRLSTYALTG